MVHGVGVLIVELLTRKRHLYKDPFDDVVEIPYAYKVMNAFIDFIPRVKLRRKQ